MAFNSKNLAYESRVPAFLQRLKAEVGGNTIERPNPRPRKAPREDDEDDEPTYVTEGNETITREEFLAMNEESNLKTESKDKNNSSNQSDPKKDGEAQESVKTKGRDTILEAGKTNQKKRKAVKVAGSDNESEKGTANKDRDRSPLKRDAINPKEDAKIKSSNSAATAKKQKKQKKGAVKLSFGDDGE